MIQMIRSDAERFAEEIKGLRMTIHRHPEMGNQEYRTAELTEKYLNGIGIATRRILDTAVVGEMKCGAGDPEKGPVRTAALRADMDALPLTEMTGAEFSSEVSGVMHACGHDVHTAAVLGAARILAEHRNELKGNVIFLLQPDEEGRGGADRMIREGCMDGVDAVFGAHVSPDLPAGHIGIRYGIFYAASDMFKVEVTGLASHGAVREKGIDALAAAAEMVTALLELPSKITSDKCILTVGRMQSGTAGNIMPGEAVFEGIIRTLGPETRRRMEEEFRNTVQAIADRTGTAADIDYIHSHPGVVNDKSMTDLAFRAACGMFGEEKVHIIEEPVMISEDFGCFLDKAHGSFYHIGAGCALPLHNPAFLPEEDVVTELAVMHAGMVWSYLME